jgi:ATP-dependent DNA ligase
MVNADGEIVTINPTSFEEPTFQEFQSALEKERKRQEAIKYLESL